MSDFTTHDARKRIWYLWDYGHIKMDDRDLLLKSIQERDAIIRALLDSFYGHYSMEGDETGFFEIEAVKAAIEATGWKAGE